MKKFVLFLVLLSACFISCSSDDDENDLITATEIIVPYQKGCTEYGYGHLLKAYVDHYDEGAVYEWVDCSGAASQEDTLAFYNYNETYFTPDISVKITKNGKSKVLSKHLDFKLCDFGYGFLGQDITDVTMNVELQYALNHSKVVTPSVRVVNAGWADEAIEWRFSVDDTDYNYMVVGNKLKWGYSMTRTYFTSSDDANLLSMMDRFANSIDKKLGVGSPDEEYGNGERHWNRNGLSIILQATKRYSNYYNRGYYYIREEVRGVGK